jgi:hypothetical protein
MSNRARTRERLTAPDEKTIARTLALLLAMRTAAAAGDTAGLIRLIEDAGDDPVAVGSVAVMFAQESAWASAQLAAARLEAARDRPPGTAFFLADEDKGTVVSSTFPPRRGERRG